MNPARLWMMGWSLGTEGALLAGALYPTLVHGAVVFGPIESATCGNVFWTLAGQRLRCAASIDPQIEQNTPAALMPVATSRGAIEFVCGVADTDVPSCPNSEAMMHRLDAAHAPYPHKFVEYRTPATASE